MKYKVGDKVRIKSIDWYNENKDKGGFIYFDNVNFTPDMSRYCGEVLTINQVLEEYGDYLMAENAYTWIDEMIEGLAGEEMIDLTSVVMEIVEEKSIQNALSYGYNLPEGYIFKDENGNVINATKIVLEKKKWYPKTYAECMKILGFTRVYTPKVKPMFDYDDDIIALQKLKHCRNAYWKIAGEEMGLAKPWEPTMETVYCISRSNNVMKCSYRGGKSNILEFPTPEMRDAFYENFKDFIENCKELL